MTATTQSRFLCDTCLKPVREGRRTCTLGHPVTDYESGDPMVRQILADRYRICAPIGSGGFGNVYLAADSRLNNRPVVIKVARRELASSQRFRDRFSAEKEAMARLPGKHTVRILDYERTGDGQYFIVQEYIEGPTLAEVMTREGTIPWSDAVAIARGMAVGLAEAHERAVLHLDIKPSNVMLIDPGAQREVKVIDFGIARLLDSGDLREERPRQVIATFEYASPEQCLAAWDRIDARSDLYSLGAVFYEMLAGFPPFLDRIREHDFEDRNEFLIRLAKAKTEGSPTPLSEVRCTEPIPEQVAALVHVLLALDPAGRPAGARDVARIIDSLPGSSVPGRARGSTDAPVARRGAWIATAAIAVVAAVVAVALFLGPTAETPTDAENTPAPWPSAIRLLVVPFGGAPERGADARLWPLVDRMIVNALEPSDRIEGMIERIDPLAVQEEMTRREMKSPPDAKGADELARALGASVILEGGIAREAGLVKLSGTLRLPSRRESAGISASGLNVVEASRGLADAVVDALGVKDHLPLQVERLSQLLLDDPRSAEALRKVLPSMSTGERMRLYGTALGEDPTAVGLAWQAFMENPHNTTMSRELKRHSENVRDPDLKQFMIEIGRPEARPDACRSIDVAALGRRYPLALGPLAEAACLMRQGKSSEAVEKALAAHGELALRPLATPFITKLLHYNRACDEIIPIAERLLRSAPEQALRWSSTADWYAHCVRMDEAKALLNVARSILDDNRNTGFFVAYHGALIHLVDLDVAGARDWMQLLELKRDQTRPDSNYFILKSLNLFLQGRFRQGNEVVKAGMDAMAGRPSDAYTMLAVSYVYSMLAEGKADLASAAVDSLDRMFPDPGDIGNRYDVAMLRLAVRSARETANSEFVAEMKRLSRPVVEKLRDVGRTERDAQECFLLSHLGLRDACKEVLFGASGATPLLGGCRFRYAETLLEGRRFAEAAEQFRLALKEMVWARFAYAGLIPAAMLGRARSLDALGDRSGAKEMYRRLTVNYANADREMPEAIAAREALAGNN